MGAPLGLRAPKLMKNPCGAQTLHEFWGQRWDTAIQDILHKYIYAPLRKRLKASRALAVLSTFVVSGLIHAWPVYMAGLEFTQSVSMMGYFLSQCGLVFLEDKLSVR